MLGLLNFVPSAYSTIGILQEHLLDHTELPCHCVQTKEQRRDSAVMMDEDTVVRHFLPDSAQEAVLAIAGYRWIVLTQPLKSRDTTRQGHISDGLLQAHSLKDGWVDLACDPSIALSIGNESHSNPDMPRLA